MKSHSFEEGDLLHTYYNKSSILILLTCADDENCKGIVVATTCHWQKVGEAYYYDLSSRYDVWEKV